VEAQFSFEQELSHNNSRLSLEIVEIMEVPLPEFSTEFMKIFDIQGIIPL
jgi:hypothetical protein